MGESKGEGRGRKRDDEKEKVEEGEEGEEGERKRGKREVGSRGGKNTG